MPKSSARSRNLRLVISLLVSGVFLYLLLRGMDLPEIGAALSSASWLWLIPATLIFTAGYQLRVWRWLILLKIENPSLSYLRCVGPFFAPIALNNLLPLRLGDLLRLFAFNSRLGIGAPLSFSTFVCERGLDLLTLLLWLPLAYHLFNAKGATDGFVFFTLLPLSAALLIAILLLQPRRVALPLLWLLKLLSVPAPRLGQRATELAGRILYALEQISSPVLLLRAFGVSLLAWSCEALVFVCAACAISSAQPKVGSLLAFPLGALSAVIPSSPGFVGTFDYFTTQGFILSGCSAEAAAACTVLAHLVILVPATLIGCTYLILHPVTISLKNLPQESV